MKVHELIDALKHIDADSDVYFYIDGKMTVEIEAEVDKTGNNIQTVRGNFRIDNRFTFDSIDEFDDNIDINLAITED